MAGKGCSANLSKLAFTGRVAKPILSAAAAKLWRDAPLRLTLASSRNLLMLKRLPQ